MGLLIDLRLRKRKIPNSLMHISSMALGITGLFLIAITMAITIGLENTQWVGTLVVGFGGVLNFLPVAFNRGTMPVWIVPVNKVAWAPIWEHKVGSILRQKNIGSRHSIMTPETKLKPLCDIFPIRDSTFSVGDVIAAVGAVWTLGAFTFYIVRMLWS